MNDTFTTKTIDERGGAAECAGGDHVHNAADNSGVTVSKHLNGGYHDGNDGGREGTVEEPANADNSVLQIHLQKVQDLRQGLGDDHDDVGKSCQHGEGCEGLRVHF